MRKVVFCLVLLVFVVSKVSFSNSFHISGNVSYAALTLIFPGISLEYTGGDDLGVRLSAGYYGSGNDGVLRLRGGLRKYLGIDRKPTGAFVEGGFGYYTVTKGDRGAIRDVNVGLFSIYGNLGYRFGDRIFLEGAVGIESFFIIFATLNAEVGIGFSF